MRFRFSGHESFPCRYTWLPKAYRALNEDPLIFADEDKAMVRLGVGKNMVRSIKFWVQAFGIAQLAPGGKVELTDFGHSLFGENGLDPFLEDIRTLWLLHWKISSQSEEPLFAWYFLLNQWVDPNFSRSEIIKAFTIESERIERPLSAFTKEQHFDIFLHTYVPVRARKGGEVLEDTLDCPLAELQLIQPAGERLMAEGGNREPVFEFRQDEKKEISGALFSYCLFVFWKQHRSQEATLSFREIAVVPGSLGQLFKLSEPDLRSRLETLQKDSDGLFEYLASAAVPRVLKHCSLDDQTATRLLYRIFGIKKGGQKPRQTPRVYAN
jgi:hypothetical protein